MTGTVIKCEGSRALLSTTPKSTPCDMCHSPCAQKSCSKLKPVMLWANNDFGASVGDTVEIEPLKSDTGLFSAFFCLILPLIAALAAFMLTRAHLEEYYAFCISLVAFLTIEIIFLPIAKIYEKKHPTLKIVKNLENL